MKKLFLALIMLVMLCIALNGENTNATTTKNVRSDYYQSPTGNVIKLEVYKNEFDDESKTLGKFQEYLKYCGFEAISKIDGETKKPDKVISFMNKIIWGDENEYPPPVIDESSIIIHSGSYIYSIDVSQFNPYFIAIALY